MTRSGFVFTGLRNRRIKTCISNKFRRIIKTIDISDFARDFTGIFRYVPFLVSIKHFSFPLVFLYLNDERKLKLGTIDGVHNILNRFGGLQNLCESGANIKAIQGILGHSDITTTMDIYTDVTQEMRDDALEAFEKYLSI